MAKRTKKTLRDINPDAVKMWAFDLNGEMTPDNVSGYSDEVAWFRCCDNPKHLFQRRIKDTYSHRDYHDVGCKYCGPNAKEAFPGETDFFTKVSESIEFWDDVQNKLLKLEPTKLLPYSAKYAHFVCANGHDEFRKITDFTKSPHCQTCAKSLLINAPNTLLFLNTNKNTLEDVQDFIKSVNRVIELACPNCNYTWSWQGGLWSERQYCPHCGYDGTEGSCERNSFVKDMYHINTLRDTNPEASAIWDYEKNGDATPDNVHGKVNTEYAFKCSEGHEFNIALARLYDKQGNPHGCPLCRGVKSFIVSGINDLVTLTPEIKDFWNYNKNDIDPTTLSKYAGYEAFFKCNKGHEFVRKVYQFSVDPVCPECRKIEHLHKYSIKNLRPESYRFWNFDKNTLDPSVTSTYLQEDAYWKCPDCGYEWVQKVSDRCTARAGKCPSHDLKRKFFEEYGIEYKESFAYKNPDASKLWNTELSNGMTPENASKSSSKEIYMNCCRSKHKPFLIKVCDINKPPYGCPECIKEDEEETYRRCSLKLNVPASIEMWNYDNNEKSLDDAKVYMSESANFKCGKGHLFSRSIKVFVHNQDCPVCGMDTVAKHSHLVKQWDFDKNTDYDINLTSANLKESVWWKCQKCGYGWQAQIFSRKQGAGHCPCCEERVVVVKGITDLFTMVPEIKEFYDFETNTGINPDELSVTSQSLVNWKCDKCGYKWNTYVCSRIVFDNGKYKVRECPSCTGKVRIRSYGEEYTDLVERFVDELNGCSLYDIFAGKDASKKYFWHCDICDENFTADVPALIRARNTASKGCSYCSGKKVLRENSFAALHPDIIDEYDLENEIDPYTVTEHSNKKVKWICRNNKTHRWEADFNSRANGQGSCNICRNYNYGIMFKDVFPEYEKYYDTDKNERPFEALTAKSNDSVWWNCERGHSFPRAVCHMNTAGAFKCPVCTGRTIVAGENDLFTEYPELVDIWDYKNNEVDPTTLSPKINDKYFFTCKKDHSYATYLNTLIDHDFRCFVCDNIVVQIGFNSLFDTDSVLCMEISENEPRKPTEFTKESKYTMLWRCPECSGEYRADINKRSVGDDSCPFCDGRRTQIGANSLIDTHPLLVEEFSPENDFTSGEIRKDLKKWVKWICPTCKGTYSKLVCEREVGDDSCPYCRGEQLLYGYNGVAQTESGAITEWADAEIDPSGVKATSSIKVDWECEECGGVYRESINKHIQDFYDEVNDCPYCNGRKILPGFNSLKQANPEWLKEWSYQNNYLICNPDLILPEFGEDVWWKCSECDYDYQMSPKNRYVYEKRHKISCPKCKGLRRKVRYFF